MAIFSLAPDQTIAQMWSNGARGGNMCNVIQHISMKSRLCTQQLKVDLTDLGRKMLVRLSEIITAVLFSRV